MSDDFVAAVKRVVADPASGPKVDDLINAEAGRLIAALNGAEFDLGAELNGSSVAARLDRYRALTSGLARSFGQGGRWSGALARPIWPAVLERVVAGVDRSGGQAMWADLSLYPGVLTYAFGIGSLAGDNSTTCAQSLYRRACAIATSGSLRRPSSTGKPSWIPTGWSPLVCRIH